MSAAELLELPEVRAQVSTISVEQYHTFPERNERGRAMELVRGIVLEKVPKSPLHATIALRICKLLLPQVPPGFTLRPDQPLTLSDSELEPDLAIVEGDDGDYLKRHPRTAKLVIEVAISSLNLDRQKAEVYAEAGVAEYWIIMARDGRAEVYRAPYSGRYQEMEVVEREGVLESSELPGVRLSLRDLPSGME